MSDERNVELHKKGHAAFLADDRETLAELVAEDSDWHIAGHRSDDFGVDRRKGGTLGGDYHGLEGFFALADKLGELSRGTYSFEDIAIMGGEEFSAALMKVTATRGSASIDAVAVEVLRWRDGQIVEEWFLPFDQTTWDAFWS